MSAPRRIVTALSAFLAAALLGGLLTAYAHSTGTGTVDPPPRTAFIARADNPADALAAGPIAGRLGAPLFTTPSNVLDSQAATGLTDYGPELVILTGGTAALSADVEAAVKAALPAATVRRVAGAGRTETARRVAELIGEYDPAFLPVDATALEALHAQSAHEADHAQTADDAAALGGMVPAAYMPDVIMSDAGAIAMPTGSNQCITDPYTPEVDRVAVAQIGLSGRNDVVGSTTLFARFLISEDDGATWSTVSQRITPEDQISNTTQGAVTHTDSVDLTAGVSYRFAVRAFGGLESGRCNMVIVASPRPSD